MKKNTLDSIKDLKPVSNKSTGEFLKNKQQMIDFVNYGVENHPSREKLIGDNDLSIAFNNHRNHSSMMASVFKFKNYLQLSGILPWVYKAYYNQGFSYEYFPVVLKLWKKALDKFVSDSAAQDIKRIYDWILENHTVIKKLSMKPGFDKFELKEHWEETYEKYLNLILEGDHKKCLKLVNEKVNSNQQKISFYTNVIKPTMYRVGRMWEEGEISIAKEHLASSVTARVMASLFFGDSKDIEKKGKAIVTAAYNEFHEIGPWMIADALEINGWEVKYLGANTPNKDLINITKDYKPDILAVSAAMPYHIDNVYSLIEKIKKTKTLSSIKIMVGGLAFKNNPDMWEQIKADGYAGSCTGAVNLAKKWWYNK